MVPLFCYWSILNLPAYCYVGFLQKMFQPNANNTNFVNIDAQHQRSSGPVPREIRSSNNPQHVDTNSNNRRRRTLSPQMQIQSTSGMVQNSSLPTTHSSLAESSRNQCQNRIYSGPNYMAPSTAVNISSNVNLNTSTESRRRNNNPPLVAPEIQIQENVLPLPRPTGTSTVQQNNFARGPASSSANTEENPSNATAVSNSNMNIKIFGSTESEKFFIFTGTVERVIKWNKIFQNHFCFFEVIAAVISIQEGSMKTQKIMLLRDKKGPILQVVYYNIATHIDIEDFHVGQVLRCVGKMTAPNILNAVSIRTATQEEIETLQRLCLICDHAVSHFLSV